MFQLSGFYYRLYNFTLTLKNLPFLGFLIMFLLYLNPEEPTFLGFFTMVSLYKSLKRVGVLQG